MHNPRYVKILILTNVYISLGSLKLIRAPLHFSGKMKIPSVSVQFTFACVSTSL